MCMGTQTATPTETSPSTALSLPNNHLPCTCWSDSRATSWASECTVSWRMRSMHRPFCRCASPLFGGVQVISQARNNQKRPLASCLQPLADYCATHPEIPQTIRIRGGDERSPGPERPVRRLLSQDQTVHRGDQIRRGRNVSLSDGIRPVLAHARYCPESFSEVVCRGFCAGLEGAGRMGPVDQAARRRGARHRVILSLLVDHALFVHPDQEAQLKNNLPAYTVGSLRQT